MAWYWISLADPTLPKGSQQIGIVMIESDVMTRDELRAMVETKPYWPPLTRPLHVACWEIEEPEDKSLTDRLIPPDEIVALDIGEPITFGGDL